MHQCGYNINKLVVRQGRDWKSQITSWMKENSVENCYAKMLISRDAGEEIHVFQNFAGAAIWAYN